MKVRDVLPILNDTFGIVFKNDDDSSEIEVLFNREDAPLDGSVISIYPHMRNKKFGEEYFVIRYTNCKED